MKRELFIRLGIITFIYMNENKRKRRDEISFRTPAKGHLFLKVVPVIVLSVGVKVVLPHHLVSKAVASRTHHVIAHKEEL